MTPPFSPAYLKAQGVQILDPVPTDRQIPPECRICGEQCTAEMREQCFREGDL